MEPHVVLQRLGITFVVAGTVLTIFLGDIDFLLLRGWALGLVLMFLGLINLVEYFKSPQRQSRGIPDELRDDLGIGSRHRDDEQE
ncbi:hypothetical protein [Streptomyces sp. DSM 40750]|uniref:hypothetical protein n=1 Tax=Streptomyces sp. DSM 40750 TaxID=2801030 RepID=UPI00214CB4BE|nr:hypothetical protein [Streptomyces sp. DSM 40750]UUU25890.1 hypothetical protein JIX55_39790 [Streptomyces sp. DSM 40750]